MLTGKWVLDVSMALAWAFPDEHSTIADAFLKEMNDEYQVWVPALFWYEVSNALTTARRRSRISDADRIRLTELFEKLPVKTDAHFAGPTFPKYSSLAIRYGLSAYDAAYLEIAARRAFGLATLDPKLRKAAESAGISVW